MVLQTRSAWVVKLLGTGDHRRAGRFFGSYIGGLLYSPGILQFTVNPVMLRRGSS
jgi:hypothetical protein